MKKFIAYLSLLTIIIICAAASVKKKMPDKMPKDFNFTIAYGYNAKNKIDSFNGEYTKDLVMNGSATCKISFTEEEMMLIYSEMQRINITDYPLHFTPPYADNPKPGITAEVSPHSAYYFKIQADNKVTEINWVDKNGSQATDARQLHAVIATIIKIVETKEEYKKLPAAKGAYL